MEKGLVNILTPAYNLNKYITRLLDSVLQQSYPKIEMFVIDDGSTDDTALTIQRYIPRFKEKGYRLNYVYQDNQGLSSTINNGLKLLTGEYLVWPDADDWYATPDAIETLVKSLSNTNDDVGVARCRYARISEKDLKLISTTKIVQKNNPGNVFRDIIYHREHFWIEPGGFMIKLKFIDTYIPGREIYVERLTGQNTQILYPYLFYSQCISINKVQFNYLVRNESHSRNLFKGYDKKIEQLDATLRNRIHTLHSIKTEQKSIIADAIAYSTYDIVHRKMALAIKYKKSAQIIKFYKELKENFDFSNFSFAEKIAYFMSYIPYGISIFYFIRKIKKIIL